MNIVIVINDAPYGTEKAFNALRLAMGLQEAQADAGLRLFLLSDGVFCAVPQQQRPQGSYHIEQMLEGVMKKGAEIMACVSCIDQRGLWDLKLIEGIRIGSMSDLSRWALEADKVVSF